MFFHFTPCYFQLKIVITQSEVWQFLLWHPQDLHAYMYSALRWCLSGPSNIAMLSDSFRILPYLSNRCADIHEGWWQASVLCKYYYTSEWCVENNAPSAGNNRYFHFYQSIRIHFFHLRDYEEKSVNKILLW